MKTGDRRLCPHGAEASEREAGVLCAPRTEASVPGFREIEWGRRFLPAFNVTPEGDLELDLSLIDRSAPE